MLTFTLPGWTSLDPRTQTIGIFPYERRVNRGGRATLAGRFAPAHPASSQRGIHEPTTDLQRQRTRRSRIRPRPVGSLSASVRDNAPDAPDVFDPHRGCEPGQDTEVVREKVELVLRLKDMGRRFEWRGALKVFRRVTAGGMVPDNSVYRSVDELFGSSCSWVLFQTIMSPADEACT